MTQETAATTQPPVAVVRADGDILGVARRIARRRSGLDIDLGAPTEPITAEDIAAEVAGIIGELTDKRAADRSRLEHQLSSRLSAAEVARRATEAEVDTWSRRRTALLQGAAWCDERREQARLLVAAVAEADTRVAAAEARAVGAERRGVEVAEQQRTAQAVIDEAHRQLVELDMAGRDENEIRRSLETANQAARDAAVAAEAAAARAAELAAAVAELEGRRAELVAALEARGNGDSDPAPVAEALAQLESAQPVPADAASLNLADEMDRLTHHIAALSDAGPGPDHATVAAAEAAVEEARVRLEQLLRPPPAAGPPSWWDQLGELHNAVVDAETAAGSASGFGRKAALKRLQEALAAERTLLDELGFPSHLDALMTGGRPAASSAPVLTVPEAEATLEAAEQELYRLRKEAVAATEPARLRSELGRRRALASAMLGVTAAEATPDALRGPRTDPALTAALRTALSMAGVQLRSGSLEDTARSWLATIAQHRRRRRLAAAELDEINTAYGAAMAVAETAAASAEQAAAEAATEARQVRVLEDELESRAGGGVDGGTRAAAAAALRDRIAALQGRIDGAREEVEAERNAADRALRTSAADRESSRDELRDLGRQFDALASSLSTSPSGADLATELADRPVAWRAEADELAVGLDGRSRALAAASAELEEIRSALVAVTADSPIEAGPAERQEALSRLLHPARRTTDVIVEPMAGTSVDEWPALLRPLLEAGSTRPVVLVTGRAEVAAWAIELPADQVAVVSARTMDPERPAGDSTAPGPNDSPDSTPTVRSPAHARPRAH